MDHTTKHTTNSVASMTRRPGVVLAALTAAAGIALAMLAASHSATQYRADLDTSPGIVASPSPSETE